MCNKCAVQVKGLLLRAINVAPSLSFNGCSVHTAMHGARARARVTSYGCTVHSSMRRTLFAWSNHFRYICAWRFFIDHKHKLTFWLILHTPGPEIRLDKCTYSMVACVSILPPLTRSYNSAQLTQLIHVDKISNFRPCFQKNVHATQLSLLNSSSSAYNLYNLTYLSQRT